MEGRPVRVRPKRDNPTTKCPGQGICTGVREEFRHLPCLALNGKRESQTVRAFRNVDQSSGARIDTQPVKGRPPAMTKSNVADERPETSHRLRRPLDRKSPRHQR